jgi:hypothetical protein
MEGKGGRSTKGLTGARRTRRIKWEKAMDREEERGIKPGLVEKASPIKESLAVRR